MSTIMLIMLPKVLAFYGPDLESQVCSQRRGSTGGVRVSGINSASFQPSDNFTDRSKNLSVQEIRLQTNDAEPTSE